MHVDNRRQRLINTRIRMVRAYTIVTKKIIEQEKIFKDLEIEDSLRGLQKITIKTDRKIAKLEDAELKL